MQMHPIHFSVRWTKVEFGSFNEQLERCTQNNEPFTNEMFSSHFFFEKILYFMHLLIMQFYFNRPYLTQL